MDFAHLHVHSNFSLLQGAFRIDELVEAAAHMGMPAVALTDTNGLYGAIEFYEAARAAGLRPVIGAEIVWGGEQCICLAASRWGYANLCRIVTERRLAGTRHYADFLASETVRAPGTPPAPFDIARSLAADPDGLFALTATPSLLRRLKDVVPEGRLYAELRADSPHSFETRCPSLRGHEDPGTGGPRAERRKTPGTDIADLAERLAVPLAATVNVNFLRPEDAEAHAVLSAIRDVRGALPEAALVEVNPDIVGWTASAILLATLTDVLKGEMKFEGFLISDWDAIRQLDYRPNQAAKVLATGRSYMLQLIMFDIRYNDPLPAMIYWAKRMGYVLCTEKKMQGCIAP